MASRYKESPFREMRELDVSRDPHLFLRNEHFYFRDDHALVTPLGNQA